MLEISIEEMKPLATRIVSELSKDREPVDDLKQVLKLVEEALLGAAFKDSKTSEYFYDDFLGRIAKNALKSSHFKNKEMVNVVKSLCVKMTLVLSKIIDSDNQVFVQHMRYVFDPSVSFYREYDKELSQDQQVYCEEPEDWRKKLNKGDNVDVVRKEDDLIGWTTGTLIEINEDSFSILLHGSDLVIKIGKASKEIAPYGIYTEKNEWRLKLSKGNTVNYQSSAGVWIQSTIMEIDLLTKPPKAKVKVKMLQKQASEITAEEKVDQGLDQVSEEWIELFSLKLQRRNTILNESVESNEGVNGIDKEAINDEKDILLNSPCDKEIFFVQRPGKESAATVVELLNILGKESGFDKILTRISNKEKPLPFELTYYYFDIIGLVWKNLHKKFAARYIPKLQTVIIDYFQNAPDVEIRKLQKDRLDKTLKNLYNLLKRILPIQERYKITEHFSLSISTIMLKSNYLQRRIDGLKNLNEIIRDVSKSISNAITAKFLAEWVQKQDILEELLGPRTHPQILQRSGRTISFLYEQHLLDQRILEKIWANAADESHQQDVFKVLQEVAFPIDSSELEFFAKKISEMNPSTISEKALDIIYDARKLGEKFPELLLKYSNILAKIAFEDCYSISMSEKALSKYVAMLAELPFEPFKRKILENSIHEMLEKNKNSVMALKLIRRIVNQHSVVKTGEVNCTKEIVLEVLLKDFNILKIFFENFDAYYKSVKLSKVQENRYTHKENINERMEFLSYVEDNSPMVKFSQEHLYKLWDMLCENPLSKDDSQVLFKFLKGRMSDKEAHGTFMEPADVEKFFDDKICHPKDSFSDLSIEAYDLLVQFFVLVNEQKGFITVTRIQEYKSSFYLNYSQLSGALNRLLNKKKDLIEKKAKDPFEVRVKVHPEKLHGGEIFWRIIQEANSKAVIEKARDFLSKLYTQLTEELETQALEIRNRFIETYLEKLNVLFTSSQPQMVERMITLIMDMIDESERKGTGRLKSHCALLKGPLISFSVHNEATSGKNIPKEMEITVHANTTIWELKAELGKYIRSSSECIKMLIGGKELKDTDNGKIINDFIEKRTGSIRLEKKNMSDVPKVPLVTEEGKLTSQSNAVFTEIFNNFAKDGKMNDEITALFMQNTTKESFVQRNDTRVRTILANFGKDNGSYLDLDGFLEFYRDAIVNRKEDLVRQNLLAHGYRNDLKNMNEIKEPIIDISSLPRYILSSNPRSFELLFKILDIDNSKVGEQVWSLISRLITNEEIYRSLLDLKGDIVWENLICTKSKYRLLYSLQIIESFLEDEALDKKEWRKNFISKGGFEFLLTIFMNQDSTKGISFNLNTNIGKFEKECLAFLGKILNAFIRSAIYLLNNQLKEEAIQIKTKLLNGEAQEEKPAPVVKVDENEKKDEKTKENQVDLKELFKQKTSEIIFLKDAKSEKKSDKNDLFILDIGEITAERILTETKSKEVWSRQIDILSSIVFREEINYFDITIISAALNLFISCTLISKEVFELAQGYNKNDLTFANILMKGLMCENSQSIREEFMNSISFLCYSSELNTLGYLLNILLLNIPKRRTSEGRNCSEYFVLLGRLIDIYYKVSIKSIVINPKELLRELIEMLKRHRSLETRSELTQDKLLIGLIKIIHKIILYESIIKDQIPIKDELLHEIIFNCLFPNLVKSGEDMPTLVESESQNGMIDPQKCKTSESRAAAYQLLATLCNGSLKSQIYVLKECIEPLCNSITPHKGWNYVPSSQGRSKFGYAGIENLGCICYMNAMLQQFYMVPTFRYGILAADDKRPPDVNNAKRIDDNVLHQLQKMFAYLELTEREDFNPSGFCYAFKDFDGRPTSTAVQQDAQEFLNLSFDRIDNILKQTPEKYLLQSVFGGKTCSQLICKGGCGNIKKNYEDFCNLSLGIRGHTTLFEALDKYVAGDNISDFSCEHCGRKVEVIKRTCLHQLPNVLVIHLERLLYNYDTQMNEKINSRLEFPKEFSIEPYTVEGMEAKEKMTTEESKSPTKETLLHGNDPAYYEYKLAGVLVHLGMAEAGHYFSYINTNRKKTKTDTEHDLFDSSKDTWLEFNDSHIRQFDITQLEADCFGGSSEGIHEIGEFSIRLFGQSNIKNAYMLVYERKLKNPLKMVVSSEEAAKLGVGREQTLECENTALARVGQVYYDVAKNEYFKFTDFNDVQPQVPPELFREVWEDNSAFIFERQIHSKEFFQFVQDILKEAHVLLPSLAPETVDEVVISMTKISAKVICEVLSRAYYNLIIEKFTDELIVLFKQYEIATREFFKYILKSELQETIILLTKCPDRLARVSISKLITELLLSSINREGKDSLAYTIENKENQQIISYKTYTGKVLHLLIKSIGKDLVQNWSRFEQFFLMLYNVTKDGGEVVFEFMNSHNLLTILLDFYLGSESPLNKMKDKRPSMGNNVEYPKFQPLINLVCLLIKNADMTFMQPKYAALKELSSPLRELDENTKECLKCKEFYTKVIMEGHSTEEFANLIKILCYDSKKFSKTIARTLLKAINEYSKVDMIPCFNLLTEIFMIKDSLEEARFEWLFGIPCPCKMMTTLDGGSLKFGLCLIDKIQDDVNDYISPLNHDNQYKSLLSLLWRHKVLYEVHPMKCLLDIMVKNSKFFNYIVSLPPPTYQYAKYPDLIHAVVTLCMNSGQSYMKLAMFLDIDEKPSANDDVVKLLKQFDELWEEVVVQHPKCIKQPEILLAFPEPYIIGKFISENYILTETKGDVTMILSELVTEIYKSLPTGKENKTVPKSYFKRLNEVKIQLNQDNTSNESKDKPEETDTKETIIEEDLKPWKTEPTILAITFENNGTKNAKIKIKFVKKLVEDTESLINFHMPISTIASVIGGQKSSAVFLATKKYVGNDQPWGNFTIDWTTELIESKKVNNGNDSVDKEFYTELDFGDDLCPNMQFTCYECGTSNHYKAIKCSKCGQCLEGCI